MGLSHFKLMPFCLFVCLALNIGIAYGQGAPSSTELARRMRDITLHLNCPLCQGQTLNECPLQVCNEMRDLISQKLQAGETDQQIIAYFVERYGDRVLNEPPREGFALLGWVMPLAGLVAGMATVLFALRSMTRRTPRPAVVTAGAHNIAPARPSAAALPPEYVERLERDLKQME